MESRTAADPVNSRQRRADDADDDARGHDELADVLTLEAAELVGLAGEIRRSGEEFLANERVVARRDEERQLLRLRGAGDLNGANAVAGFGQNQRLGEEASQSRSTPPARSRAIMPCRCPT